MQIKAGETTMNGNLKKTKEMKAVIRCLDSLFKFPFVDLHKTLRERL